MTTPPAGDTGTAPPHQAPSLEDDDFSVHTAPSGAGSTPKDRKMNEYVARFTYQSKDDAAITIFSNLHTILLQALLDAHGSSIRIYSKANQRLESIPVAEWNAKLTHGKHFTIHRYKTKSGTDKFVIQHRIYFDESFAKLKRPMEVMKFLRDNKI